MASDKQPIRLVMMDSVIRFGPRLDVPPIMMIPEQQMECLNCDEKIPRGKILFFCGEACEAAFEERFPGVIAERGLYSPFTRKVGQLLEGEADGG